ncbi:MAG TPA: acyloxyacyl hydrolase [Burkholderiales bacterium]|nr:acyloxyacyl hydrolase [Burkholderiales bacterium]
MQGRAEYWRAHEHRQSPTQLYDFSLTPILRVAPAKPSGFVTPYVEAGIGVHLLTETRVADRRFGSAFQFGELIGVGLRFGSRQQVDVGMRAQHVSNGGIAQPNEGLTFATIGVAYRF